MARFVRLLLAATLMSFALRADAQTVTTLWNARTTAGTSNTVTVSRSAHTAVQLAVGTCTGDYDLIVEGFLGTWQPITLTGGSAHITSAEVGASAAESWAIPAGFLKLRSTIAAGIANCSVSLYVFTD